MGYGRSLKQEDAMRLVVLACVLVAGCTTQEAVLRHPQTGQVARCGGNGGAFFTGGLLGQAIQEANDAKCTAAFMEQGFVRVR